VGGRLGDVWRGWWLVLFGGNQTILLASGGFIDEMVGSFGSSQLTNFVSDESNAAFRV
jgi:hypothetical protein